MGQLPLEKYIVQTLRGLCWGWGGAERADACSPQREGGRK